MNKQPRNWREWKPMPAHSGRYAVRAEVEGAIIYLAPRTNGGIETRDTPHEFASLSDAELAIEAWSETYGD